MTPSPILAVLMAFGMVLLGNALEGGTLGAMYQPSAFMIVMGGCAGATWLASTDQEIKTLFKMMPRLLRPNTGDRKALLEVMVKAANMVRRDGMLALEAMLPEIPDEFMKRGLRALVDGWAAPEVERLLTLEMELDEHHQTSAAKVLETAGGFAPTVGILGAVLGLIHVMKNLADPSKLGEGIAVAFVATIYGVGFANLLFIPLGNRLKKIAQDEAETRAMIITGLSIIASGAGPRQVADTLAVFTGHHEPAKEAA